MRGGVGVGLSLCGLGRAACFALAFLLWCSPAFAHGTLYERLSYGEWGLAIVPMPIRAVLCGGFLYGLGQRKAEAL